MNYELHGGRGGAFAGSAARCAWPCVRLLRANPAFALVAILSLALGIGANTAIFELLEAVLLRTPVAAPEQLAEVRLNHQGRIGSTVARQQDFRARSGRR